ncbi:hypothetical protein E2C01_066634 [Portunus trituberculatus]|uniref:Uncharacterized protein n=1 Tax=Portunus trituberculatus TaxID=210409 RepID=A0A5B7HHM8_PORTR|nr:hypothetical protein [Portunus trituberculatus]
MKQANRAYLKANEKNPSLVGYLSDRFAKIYSVVGKEVFEKAALVNLNLHNALYPGVREPCMNTWRWPGWRG